jgi:glycosyltransferase involved in cell wall biosynthesis/GT2 family glycosyltransferase
MQIPFVSVIVCTYNRDHYLDACLLSLKRQVYERFEVIVVNGPSEDMTDSVLDKYPEIKVVRQEALNGLSYARNLGIHHSRGEIIAFLDDDAVADRYWIHDLVLGYINDTIGGVGGPVFDSSGKWHQFKNGYISKSGIPTFINEHDRNYNDPSGAYLNYIMGTNASFRRDALYKAGLFDPEIRYYLDETDVCVRVIQAGYTIRHIDDAIVYHEMAEGHNRASPYDVNYLEIVKNVMYFILKNFRGEVRSYFLRPFEAMIYWMKIDFGHYISKNITFKQCVSIAIKIIKGAFLGYLKGLRLKTADSPDEEECLMALCDDKGPESSNCNYLHDGRDRLIIALVSQEYAKDCRGGICRYTYDLAHELVRLGHTIHIVTHSDKASDYMDGGVFIHAVTFEPVAFLDLDPSMHVSEKNLSYSYAVCEKLLDLIDSEHIQLVEAPLWDAEGFVFSLIKPVPLVVRIETPLFKVAEILEWEVSRDLKLAHWMEGEVVRRADKVVAISRAIGDLIGSVHSVAKERIVVSPLGIALSDGDACSLSDNDPILSVLFVGRLEKRKGIDTLFESIPCVIHHVPDVRFTIVGGDTPHPSGVSYKHYLLRNLDKKYHGYVDFKGFVSNSDLQDYYRRCDLFVAPSLYESFGLIYLEAMAWGKPVIGSDVGGVPEVIADGRTGLIVPPGDAEALGEALICLLKNPGERMAMGEMAARMVKKNFTRECMAEETIRIYRDLVSD